MVTRPGDLSSKMRGLKKARKLVLETSSESATIQAARKTLPVSEEFDFETANPGNSTGMHIPGRFDAELASCIVRGTLPKEIDGTYYRVACDNQFVGRNRIDKTNNFDNWINGDGAIDAWRFSNGVVDFKQKFVRSPRFIMERAARKPLFGFYRNPWSGDPRVFDEIQSPGNVHIHYWRDMLLAPKDDSPPIAMDPDTLETIGIYDFDGQLNSTTFSSHPKIDVETGEMVGFGMEATGIGSNDLVYYQFDRDGKKIDECWIKTPHVSWAHDMAVTEKWVVFMLMPWQTDIEYMKKTGGVHFRYNRNLPITFGVLPRRNPKPEDLRWFTSFKNHGCAHFSNHFDGEDGCIYMDTFLVDGDVLGVFPDMHPELGAANPDTPVGMFVRMKIDPTATSTEMEPPVVLSEIMGEMARCDDRYATKPYKHAFGIAWGETDFTGVVHINVETGVSKVWNAGPNTSCTEPIFVPRSKDAPEGDGYLISCVRNEDSMTTHIAVLNALDINSGPICLVEIPLRLKIAAHGTWVNAYERSVRKPLVDYTGVTPDILEKYATGAPKAYDPLNVRRVGLKYKPGPFGPDSTYAMKRSVETNGTNGINGTNGTNGLHS